MLWFATCVCVLLMNLGRLGNSGEIRDTKNITSNEWRWIAGECEMSSDIIRFVFRPEAFICVLWEYVDDWLALVTDGAAARGQWDN